MEDLSGVTEVRKERGMYVVIDKTNREVYIRLTRKEIINLDNFSANN